MAGSNQLIVEVIGDTSRLTRDLRSANTQINRFAATASRPIRSTGADQLLANVRLMQLQTVALENRLQSVDTTAVSTGRSLKGMGVGALAAGVAATVLGQNMAKMGGNAAKLGKALTSLTSFDLVGFGEALRDTEGKQKALTLELLKSGDASKAMDVANRASALGMDALALSAKGAAAAIRDQTNAFVDATKIRDSTSPGAIGSETSGLPLPKRTVGLTQKLQASLALAGTTPGSRDDLEQARIAKTFLENQLHPSKKEFSLAGDNQGLTKPGNLDLLHRKIVQLGKDIATVRSITVQFDKDFVVLPTAINGKIVSATKAIEHFRKTGENLGTFNSNKAAESYAQRLHLQQQSFYGKKGLTDKEKEQIAKELSDVNSLIAKARAEATAAAAARVAARLKALQNNADLAAVSVDKVSLALERASATPTLRDDIEAYKQITGALANQETAIRAQLAVQKNNAALQQQLVSLQGQQIANENALAAAVKARATAQKNAAAAVIQKNQFRALGLAPDGGELVPTIANLRKQQESLTDRLASSTVKLSSKLKSQLEGARKVLNDQINKATPESRARIKELFDAIRGEFDKQGKGPLTKTTGLNTKKIVEGLGLSPDEVRALRGRLSGFNSDGRAIAGGRTSNNGGFVGGRGQVVESHVTVQLDGQTVGKAVTRNQQKNKSRNPSQRRGPNRGK